MWWYCLSVLFHICTVYGDPYGYNYNGNDMNRVYTSETKVKNDGPDTATIILIVGLCVGGALFLGAIVAAAACFFYMMRKRSGYYNNQNVMVV